MNIDMPQMGNVNTESKGLLVIQEYAIKNNIIWRPTSVHDTGIDGQLEYSANNFATGQLIAIQSKSGSSFFPKNYKNNLSLGNWKFSAFEEKHFNYWKNYIIPVILIIHNPDDSQTYWIDVRDYFKKYNQKPSSIEIPYSNKLNLTEPRQLFQNIVATDFHKNIIKINKISDIIDIQQVDNIIELFFISRDFTNALEWIEERIKLSQNDIDKIIFKKAFILAELGRYNEAIEEYSRYETLLISTTNYTANSKLFLAIYNKASCYANKCQFLKALLEYKRLINNFENSDEYRENMVTILLNKCKFLEFERFSVDEVEKEYVHLITILRNSSNNDDFLRVSIEYLDFLKKEKAIDLIDMEQLISNLFPEIKNKNDIYFKLINSLFNTALYYEGIDFEKAKQKYNEIINYYEYRYRDLTNYDLLLVKLYIQSIINISFPHTLKELCESSNKEQIIFAINCYSKVIDLFNLKSSYNNDYFVCFKLYDKEVLILLAQVLYNVIYLKLYHVDLWGSSTDNYGFYYKILQKINDMTDQECINILNNIQIEIKNKIN